MAGRKNGAASNGKLTPKQDKYCRLRAAGKSQRDAYKASYNTHGTKKSMDEQACRLEHLEAIQARIARLQQQAEAGAILDAAQIKSMLSDMATDQDRPDSIRIKATDQLTRMIGGYDDHVKISASNPDSIRDAILDDMQ